jgi:hypothetical protein
MKEIADASMQAAESLTPPQAATKIMAGMAEWRNGGMADGRNGGMAERMAEWSNGGNGYLRTIYGTRRHRRHRRRHLNLLYYTDRSLIPLLSRSH